MVEKMLNTLVLVVHYEFFCRIIRQSASPLCLWGSGQLENFVPALIKAHAIRDGLWTCTLCTMYASRRDYVCILGQGWLIEYGSTSMKPSKDWLLMSKDVSDWNHMLSLLLQIQTAAQDLSISLILRSLDMEKMAHFPTHFLDDNRTQVGWVAVFLLNGSFFAY